MQILRNLRMKHQIKVGLVGSAGLGKSGVATKLSETLGIPLILSKEITRPILLAHGFDYSKGTCVERFLSKKEIEFEIVNERVLRESMKPEGFVTDRTTLECFAYALLSVERYTDDEISTLEAFCRGNMSCYTNIYYFPYNKGWFTENGIRTTNVHFQWKIDCIIRGLLADWNIQYTEVDTESAYQQIFDGLSASKQL